MYSQCIIRQILKSVQKPFRTLSVDSIFVTAKYEPYNIVMARYVVFLSCTEYEYLLAKGFVT